MAELTITKLDEDEFFISKTTDPMTGLIVSKETGDLLVAAEPLLLACRIALQAIVDNNQLLKDSAVDHLQTAISLAEGNI